MDKETLCAFSTVYSIHPSVSIGNCFQDTRPPAQPVNTKGSKLQISMYTKNPSFVERRYICVHTCMCVCMQVSIHVCTQTCAQKLTIDLPGYGIMALLFFFYTYIFNAEHSENTNSFKNNVLPLLKY